MLRAADPSGPPADSRDGVSECIEGWITDWTVSCCGGNECATPNRQTTRAKMTTNHTQRRRYFLVGPWRFAERLFLLGSTSSTGPSLPLSFLRSSVACAIARHPLWRRIASWPAQGSSFHEVLIPNALSGGNRLHRRPMLNPNILWLLASVCLCTFFRC